MMPDRSSREHLALTALALRADLLRHLGPEREPSSARRLLTAAPDRWSFLLRVECCALPLVARLRRDALFDRFDDASRAQLLAAEARELQRVLAARLLVRELDAIGERAGVRFTVLKGGAVAADAGRPPLDLGDVDVLVTGESTERAWRALLAHGWSPVVSGISPNDDLGARTHYAPLRSDRHELALELHARFDYLAAADTGHAGTIEPIAGYRVIDRLTGPAAVAATLRHSVVAHPHRRGHLRDLFLLSELLRELDERERATLERELSTADQSIELLAMLTQARALANGEPPSDPDALRPFVCFKYAVAAGTTALLGTGFSAWDAVSHIPLERPSVRRAAYRRLFRTATEPVPTESSLQRHRFLGSRWARALGLPRLIRSVRQTALIFSLIAVGGMIRRHAKALSRIPKGVD